MPSLLIVRHARSSWNDEGRWQGQADPPLSATGEKQVTLATARLATARLATARLAAGSVVAKGTGAAHRASFDLVISSDLRRARRTAELMASGLGLEVPHVVIPGLRELDVGDWSGLTRSEIEARWPGRLAAFDAGDMAGTPGGESRSDFDARVIGAARQLVETIRAMQASRTLVVIHGGVIRSLERTTGLVETRVTHLAGYEAEVRAESIGLIEPVDLLAGSFDLGRDDPAMAAP